jgi:hypothetical protein
VYVKTPLPVVAFTEKLAMAPVATVTALGWVLMVGADTVVSVALVDVTDPPELDTVTV